MPGSELRWCFSSDAKNYLIVTRSLCHSKPIMVVRDLPHMEMNMFELYKTLERKGFTCSVCNRSERKRIKQLAYTPGDEGAAKVWYLEAGTPPSRYYLICLLHAETHQQPVPALADAATAQRILVDSALMAPKPEQPRASHQMQATCTSSLSCLLPCPFPVLPCSPAKSL